jgi:hypothetical protein
LAPRTAEAAPPCLGSGNLCEPDKLCTFRVALAEKKFILSIFKRNAPSPRRPNGGPLYLAAVQEARTQLPNGTATQRAEQAGANFQEKVRQYAEANFKVPTCSSGTLDTSLLPKAGYNGMHTTPACQVFVNYNAGDYDPSGFGSGDATSCPEFYDRDRAHEEIHRRACVAGGAGRLGIDRMIQEEITAYDHSVRLSRAYVRMLSIRCSATATRAQRQTRARDIQQLLSPYLAKGG